MDRVGGGDSFTAGLLYGVMNDYGPQETIEYAAAASCLKQTMELDFNLSTADEVKRLVAGDGSGRVQRSLTRSKWPPGRREEQQPGGRIMC